MKQFYVGEPVTEFPAGTWNQLVRGEMRDRAKGETPALFPGIEPWSAVKAYITNTSDDPVPVGGVLKISSVLVTPTTNSQTVFDGLQFVGETPSASDPDQHIVVLIEPVKVNRAGWGVIPNATWAKVNVSDAGHNFAQPKASVDELESSGTVGYPVIWKESGTGAGKWAVVSLCKSSSATLIIGLVTSTIAVASMDGTAKTITKGITSGAVTKMKWSSGNLVADGSAIHGINLSKTQLRASTGEPLAVVGYITKEAGVDEAFVVTGLYDHRMLPGLDSANHQAAYHAAGAVTFQLGFEDCPTEE